MKRLRLAVIGLGKLGRACGEAILDAEDLAVAGYVRRPESLGKPLPANLGRAPVAANVGDLQEVDAALVCVPTELVLSVIHDLLQHGIPIVECAVLPRDAYRVHKEKIQRAALRHRVPAIVGAGWDPGALSIFRDMFSLLAPKGHTETKYRTGKSLHHSLTARTKPGIRDALCTELRTASGKMQRYVYVELESAANPERVAQAIRSDPLFLDEETLVFPVDSLAALKEEGQGIVLERWGTSGPSAHQLLLLEARFDVQMLSAQVMVGAARAVMTQAPGAHSLLEVPLISLWGAVRDRAEVEWF